MKNIKLFIVTLLLCAFGQAQQNTVTGLVLDESGICTYSN
jgi:predicted small secreted protein